jgi:hypothetical protein
MATTNEAVDAEGYIIEEFPECTQCRRGSSQHGCSRCSGTGNEPQIRRVKVWACPFCENYYASSSQELIDLTQSDRTSITGDPTGNRALCPNGHGEREVCMATIYIPVRGK